MWHFVIVFTNIIDGKLESDPLDHYPSDEEIEFLTPIVWSNSVVYANVEKRFYCGTENNQEFYNNHMRSRREGRM